MLILALHPNQPPTSRGEEVAGLSRRIDAAEERFRTDLEDLFQLEVIRAARALDLELRLVERAGLEIECTLLSDRDRRQLELEVFDRIGFARYRLAECEGASMAATALSSVLRQMRAANEASNPRLAAKLHDELGELPRGSFSLLRRLTRALEAERERARPAPK